MPNGVPTPMQPSDPGSSQVVAARPTRAKLRKSPPSATTMASGGSCSLQRGEQAVRVDASGAVRRRVLPSRRAACARARRARERSPRAQSRSSAGARAPAASTIARKRRRRQSARISTSPRRLSRSSAATSAMRTKRASPNTAGEPYASWKSSRRPTVSTTSASCITVPRIAATTRRMVVGHEAAALAGVEIRGAQPVEQAHAARDPPPRAPRPLMTSGRRADHRHVHRRVRRAAGRAAGADAASAAGARRAAARAALPRAACRSGNPGRRDRARRPRPARAPRLRRARAAPAPARARSARSA